MATMGTFVVLFTLLYLAWLVLKASRWGGFIRRRRHVRYIRQASRTLAKIRGFQGEMSEARVFGYLRKISPYAMEELVLTCLAEQGHRVRRNHSYSGDGGIDGRVTIDDQPYLIQTKRYRSHIRLGDIQRFVVLVRSRHGTGGIFVHTGRTGRKAWQTLSGTQVHIISGNRLLDLVLRRREPWRSDSRWPPLRRHNDSANFDGLYCSFFRDLRKRKISKA